MAEGNWHHPSAIGIQFQVITLTRDYQLNLRQPMHLLFLFTFFSCLVTQFFLHDYLSCSLVFNYHACLILTYALIGSP